LKSNDGIDESELIRRFQGGESWAFDRLMELHQKRVYRIALGMLGDHDSAADIVQEAFVRAFRSMHRFEGRAGIATWLHRIAVNLCLSEIRKRKLRRSLSLGELAGKLMGAMARPGRELESQESGAQIRRALATLPPRQRAVFVMRHEGEMGHAEIAEALGISEGAVRASFFHALRKLREELRDHD